MIDESLQQPQTPRQKPRQWPISLLAVLLFLGALILVIMQALRRCGDATGAGGQLQWGDLRPLALPGGLFLIGLLLLGLRALLMSRRPKSETTNRRYGLLSLALLPIFFSIIFTCSQFALMSYPPCSLEIAINPMATADYGAWPYTVFQKVDPRMGTEIALDSFYTPFIPVTVNPIVANFEIPKDPTEAAILTAAAATFAIPTVDSNHTLAPEEATKAAVDAATLTSVSAATETAALTITISATPDSSATPTVTGTLSVTPTPTVTITGTLSATPIPTVTITGTLSATPVPTATVTGTLSATPAASASANPSASATVSNPLTETPAAAATATAVSAASATARNTQTVAAALTSTAAGTSTALVTSATPTPSLTSTATTIPVIPTMTPFPTVFVPPPTVPVVPIPTAMPTFTRTPTRTPTPTLSPTIGPSPTPSNTLTPTDTLTPTITLTPTATNTPFGLGSIYREYWLSLSASTAVSALTSSPNYPNSPNGCDLLPSFDAPMNWANNFGTRMHGYLYPPTTGLYTFWIASDDNGELWLSSDMNPANEVLIATVPGWTNPLQWTKYPAQQQSADILLVAGQGYYIDALQKEGGGLDNLSVAWQGPGIPQAVIPGAYLAPYATSCTFIPTATFTFTPSATFTLTPSPTNTLTPTPTNTNTPVPPPLSANVYMAMSVSNPNPNVGDTIQYNITYGNLGPDTATGVQLVSPLPAQVTYDSHIGGTFNPGTGIWTLPDLISGQNGNLSISVIVSPAAAGQTIPNSASITSAVGDPDGSNNNANTSITVP
jgi:uncharacterized repeat protein (TIGR01451 family)